MSGVENETCTEDSAGKDRGDHTGESRSGGSTSEGSIWTEPGIRPLAMLALLGFTGYAVLLPVAPMWAAHGGADAAGVGLVNGVYFLVTVIATVCVPWLVRRFGRFTMMALALVLLGVPSIAYGFSSALTPVLILSSLRGVGLGILSVVGSAAVAQLVDAPRRGSAIGAYGLAVAMPNIVVLPLGPAIVDVLGFWPIFLVGGLPLFAVPCALSVSRIIDARATLTGPTPVRRRDAAARASATRSTAVALRALARPTAILVVTTLPAGALLSFLPQIVARPWIAAVALLVIGVVAAVSRYGMGVVIDRHGPEAGARRCLCAMAAGMGCSAFAVWPAVREGVALHAGALVLGAAFAGVAYGALQSATLSMAFAAAPPRRVGLASAVWNIGFDAGSGLGSVVVGLLAVSAGFDIAFAVVALGCLTAVPILRRSEPSVLWGRVSTRHLRAPRPMRRARRGAQRTTSPRPGAGAGAGARAARSFERSPR